VEEMEGRGSGGWRGGLQPTYLCASSAAVVVVVGSKAGYTARSFVAMEVTKHPNAEALSLCTPPSPFVFDHIAVTTIIMIILLNYDYNYYIIIMTIITIVISILTEMFSPTPVVSVVSVVSVFRARWPSPVTASRNPAIRPLLVVLILIFDLKIIILFSTRSL
jgi:hypothetical protein